MGELAGFPNFEIGSQQEWRGQRPAAVKQVRDFLAQGRVTDLLIVSHGWNNNMAEARDLYRRIFRHRAQGHGRNAVPASITEIRRRQRAVAVEEVRRGRAHTQRSRGRGLSGSRSCHGKTTDGLKGVFDHAQRGCRPRGKRTVGAGHWKARQRRSGSWPDLSAR